MMTGQIAICSLETHGNCTSVKMVRLIDNII